MTQVPVTPNYGAPQPQQATSGLAIGSLVTGIIGLFFCFPYLAIPCAILAIVLGVMAGKQVRQGAGGGGMARAGMIMGIIGLLLDVIAIILIFTVGLTFMNWAKQQQQQMQQQQQQQQTAPPPVTSAPTQSFHQQRSF